MVGAVFMLLLARAAFVDSVEGCVDEGESCRYNVCCHPSICMSGPSGPECTKFQKADADLNFLTRKLQMESLQADGENNAVKLVTQIEEVKTEFSQIAKDISDIQAAQKEAMDFFRSSLSTMTQLVSKLDMQPENSELTEEACGVYEALSQLLGIPAKNLLPLITGQSGDQNSSTNDDVSGVTANRGHRDLKPGDPCLDVGKNKKKDAGCPASLASERRAHGSEFTEVTKEEFMSVSELVRGKVKLEDLNRTYKMLWQHFKEEGKRDELSPRAMNSMGLRVSGATGEAKLKVLRALKLCQISKNGDVKLT